MANSGKQMEIAPELPSSESREVKQLKNMGGSELKEQVLKGRVRAIAEECPASGTQVGGAERRDGQGRTDRGHKGASATRAVCPRHCQLSPARARGTHLPRQEGSQKTHSKERASL